MAKPLATSTISVKALDKGTPLSWRAAEQSVQKDAVSFYVKTFNVDADEARRRLAVQVKVPNLEPNLRSRLGDTFTQLWFDNDAGRWTVAVADGTKDAALARYMQRVGLQAAYAVRHVGFGRAELDDTLERVRDQVEKTYEPGEAIVSLGDAEINVAVSQEGEQRDPDLSTAARSGDPGPAVNVKLTHKPAETVKPSMWCAFPLCDFQVGGVRYYWPFVNAANPYCTMGFTVRSGGTPNPLILTAGHCTMPQAMGGNYVSWATCNPGWVSCGPQGHQIPYYYYGNGGGDAGLLINNAGSAYPPYPGYYNWSNGALVQIIGINYANNITVCLNGSTSGSSCGLMTSTNAGPITYSDGQVVNGMTTVSGSMCGIPGDSGGPVVTGNLAVGIMSASTWSGPPGGPYTCPTVNYVEPISRALAQLGIGLW